MGARRKPEVVLKMALLAAVVDQVDSGIDVLEFDFGVIGDVGVPLLRVVADK